MMTNPLAAMMKFPDGGIAPAHRVTAMAAGVKARFIVAVLVTADANDSGQLEPIVAATLARLARVGVPDDAPLCATADAGYCSSQDLAFAEQARERIDVLINITRPPGPRPHLYGLDQFVVREDGATCPAGRAMKGPWRRRNGVVEFTGIGCADCPLKPRCTEGKARTLSVNPALERRRAEMRSRLATADGKRRYHKRMATVEPVFSNLESVMGYRRATTRRTQSVLAEVLLKVLAHNISRLIAARRLSVVYCLLGPDAVLTRLPE